jgi:hypothetical protein
MPKNRGGLAIVELILSSQGPLQYPIQNVKKEAFWRNFGGLLNFFV